jgi:hypothetical protein
MKTKGLLFLFIPAAVIFFLVRFVSDVYLAVGDSRGAGEKMEFYKLGHRIFPLGHSAAYKCGYVLLESGYESKNNALILESIDWFKKAAARNPFHYHSHYYLGKSYLFHNYPHSQYFNEAVSHFKKAALIRGGNRAIALDTCKILLSMWPFLSDADKRFCQDLLSQSMTRFLWEDFAGILEPWWLYSKDKNFLEQLLEKNPVFFYSAAEKLTQLGAPLSLRWEFLAEYEKFLLEQVNRQYQSLSFQQKDELKTLLPLLENLKTIRAYYKLAGNETFDGEKYRELKNELLHQVIDALFETSHHKENHKIEYEREINRYIDEYIKGDLPREQVLKFKEYLKKKDFFKPNDFTSLYFKYLPEFKSGNFNGIINGIEGLKKSITYINVDKQDSYIQLLLLLADSYEASNLLSLAEETLKEIIGMQPDNFDACFSLLRIRRVFGEEGEDKGKIKENIDSLKSSRKFELNPVKPGTGKPVYLVGNNSIEISFGDHLKVKKEIKTKLLQVFVDGWIKYENYISLLPEVIRVEIKPGSQKEEMSKHRVEVKVVKYN